MPLTLVITAADGSERDLPFSDLVLPTIIGRDSEASKVVIADTQASRAHTKLSPHGSGLLVEDLGSRNGTWLNGERIHKATLKPGDRLRLGATVIELRDGAVAPDPLEGSTVGGFALHEVIGKGRYGTVYRATQTALNRPVAVKILSQECRRDPALVAAFLAEARRAGKLNHPHVVQVHDVVQLDGQYLLVMEQMAGSAADQLREEGTFGDHAVLLVLRDVARALVYAEAQHLVHRDVKPDNILVNEDGIYKLADLGIAAPTDERGQAHQERVFGSPHYVAPEQARGGTIDGRADLYALGATAWHLVTGKPIFVGTTRQVISAHLNQPIPDLRSLAPDLARSTIDLVCRLLAKDPEQRPGRSSDVLTLVEQLLAEPRGNERKRVRRIVRRRRRYR